MEESADSAVESAIEQYLKPLLPSWSDEELRALVLSHGKDVSVAYEAAASLGPEPDELSASEIADAATPSASASAAVIAAWSALL